MSDWRSAPVVDDWRSAPVVEETQQSKPWSTFNDPRGALLTVGSDLVGTVAGGVAGLAGTAAGMFPGGESPNEKGNRWLNATRDAISIPPPNEASAEVLEGAEKIGRALSAPIAAAGVYGPEEETLAAHQYQREFGETPEEKKERLNAILDEGVMRSMGGATLDATGSPALATFVETAPAALVALLGGKGVSAKPGKSLSTEVRRQDFIQQADPTKAPTTKELKSAAGRAYDAAEGSGVIVSGKSFSGAVDRITQRMIDEGIDQKLTPKALAALERLMDRADKNFTLKGLEIERKAIKAAESTLDKADARLATIMRRELDDYVSKLNQSDLLDGSPQAFEALKEARSLWQRASKAEIIEGIIQKAQIEGGVNYTQAGLDQALRRNFANLLKNERKIKQFSPEEQAAIRQVALGASGQNTLRQLGKFGSSSPVAAGQSVGIGGAVGYTLGGPPGAVVGGAALPLLGRAAKSLSARKTRKNAAMTSELVRGGVKEPGQTMTRRQMVLAGLLVPEQAN